MTRVPADATKKDIEIFNKLTEKEIYYIALKHIADINRRLRNGTVEKLRKEANK